MKYSRTMRQSGTEYANAICHIHSHSLPIKFIILIGMAILGIAWGLS